MKRILYAGFAAFLLFSTQASAEVAAGCEAPSAGTPKFFYVDPVKGSPSGDGSSTRPWRTLKEVVDAKLISSFDKNGAVRNPNGPVKGGDVIYLRSGNHGAVRMDGMHNKKFLSIMAEPGQTPVLNGLQMGGGKRILIAGLTLQGAGMTARGGTQESFWGPLENLVVTGNKVQSAPDADKWQPQDWLDRGISTGLVFQGKCITATNNAVQFVRHGIGVVSGDSVLLKNNTVDYFVDDAMRYGETDNLTIQGNRLTNHYGKVLDGNHNDGIQGWNLTPVLKQNVLIDSNIIIESTGQYAQIPARRVDLSSQDNLQGIAIFDGRWKNVKVTNNVVVISAYHGINLSGVDDSLIANNTVMSSLHDGFVTPNVTKRAWINVGPAKNKSPSRNVTVRNNIARLIMGGGENVMLDHNIKIAPGTDTDAAKVFKQYDPFNARYDFRLLAGSPAIDAGLADLAPRLDVMGVTRRLPMDIGAYDAAAAQAPDKPQPTTPTGPVGPITKGKKGTITVTANARQQGTVKLTALVNGKEVGTALIVADVHTGQVGSYKFEFEAANLPERVTLRLDGYGANVQKYASLNLFNAMLTMENEKTRTDLIRTLQPTVTGVAIVTPGKGVAIQTNGSAVTYSLAQTAIAGNGKGTSIR